MDDTAAPPLPFMSGALPSSEKEVPTVVERPPSFEKDIPIDDDTSPPTRHSDIHPARSKHASSLDLPGATRTSPQPSFVSRRRSVSAGREFMHSFRRRGSTKSSMARPASLRRHSSFHSGMARSHRVPSMATFRTVSSYNDPFFLDQPANNPGPARQLRRRPGGDLRAAGNVQDLEQPQRPHSTGTVSNRTHSIANSVILRSNRYVEPSEEADDVTEDEARSVNSEKRTISLVDTHSSQPNLRPSFEVEVAKLAALPDDTDDDGGIESALMKLEGRYEKKSPDVAKAPKQSPHASTAPVESSQASWIPSEIDSSQPQSYARGDDVLDRPLAPPEAEGQGMYQLSGEAFSGRVRPVQSATESDDSYSSMPILDVVLAGSLHKGE